MKLTEGLPEFTNPDEGDDGSNRSVFDSMAKLVGSALGGITRGTAVKVDRVVSMGVSGSTDPGSRTKIVVEVKKGTGDTVRWMRYSMSDSYRTNNGDV